MVSHGYSRYTPQLLSGIVDKHRMSSTINIKIRELREGLGLGRQAFVDRTGIPKNTLIKVEQGYHDPSYTTIKAIIYVWPEYTLWLMNDQVAPEAGQISPEIEIARSNSPKAENKAG